MFCVLALTGVISGQEFITIFAVIVSFYFGTQSTKRTDVVYTGLQQNGETVVIQTVPATGTVDASVQNDVHPPDDVVAKGFAE